MSSAAKLFIVLFYFLNLSSYKEVGTQGARYDSDSHDPRRGVELLVGQEPQDSQSDRRNKHPPRRIANCS